MKIGESYVFVGEDVKDNHFKNFTYGKTYRISSFSTLPDTDIYGNGFAILFDNFEYGCLNCHFEKYFVSINEFRNKQILNIIK